MFRVIVTCPAKIPCRRNYVLRQTKMYSCSSVSATENCHTNYCALSNRWAKPVLPRRSELEAGGKYNAVSNARQNRWSDTLLYVTDPLTLPLNHPSCLILLSRQQNYVISLFSPILLFKSFVIQFSLL